MAKAVRQLTVKVVTGLLEKHETMSGELADTYFTKEQRRLGSTARSHNAMCESILAGLDQALRKAPRQGVGKMGGLVAGGRNKTVVLQCEKLMDPLACEEANADSRAAQQGGKRWVLLNKMNTKKIQAYRAAEAERSSRRRKRAK